MNDAKVVPLPKRPEIETMTGLCTNKTLCDHAKQLVLERDNAVTRADELEGGMQEIAELCGVMDIDGMIVADMVDLVREKATHVDSLRRFVEALPCPNPQCTDGSIINTGPDPQNDACEWCYIRHMLLNPADVERSDGPEA